MLAYTSGRPQTPQLVNDTRVLFFSFVIYLPQRVELNLIPIGLINIYILLVIVLW